MWTILKFSSPSSSSSSSPQIRFRFCVFFFFLLQATSPAEGGSIPSPISIPLPTKSSARHQPTPSHDTREGRVSRRSSLGWAKPRPLPTSAVEPRRSSALGDTFASARRPSKHADEREIGERKREKSGRQSRGERKERRERRERKLIWDILYGGIQVILQKHGY